MLEEENAPSHMTISNFINKELSGSMDQIFNDINSYIFAQEKVDTDHVYIDGTKIEANANKYTWVWKKSCIKSRNKVFDKLTSLIQEMNEIVAFYRRATFDARQEYTIEYVDFILASFLKAVGMTEADFVHGKGKRKTSVQRLYEKVLDCRKKLKEYAYNTDF